ncbi:MAG: hypothetical protein HGB18_04720 [Candidatus Moranbacteria bacterium]|nr:hypothetical protein [Candidatus Moranbacteria bacterium]
MLFEIPWPKRKGSVSESGAPNREALQPTSEAAPDPREAGIIVGGEPETYPAERPVASDPVRDDGIISSEGGPEYSLEEKVGFLSAWRDDLAELARSIEDLPSDEVFNTLQADEAALKIGWDKTGDVRLTWMRKTGEGESSRRDEVDDMQKIAEAFPLAVLETVFDRAKDVLEYHRKRQELKKGGPQPPDAE